jgi:hypothetical protein
MFLQPKYLRNSIFIITLFVLKIGVSQLKDSTFIGEYKKGKNLYASCYLIDKTNYKIHFSDVLNDNDIVFFSLNTDEFLELYNDINNGLTLKPQFDIIKKYVNGTLTIHFSKSNFQFMWYQNKKLSVSPFINKKKLILFLGKINK